jgi:hypothetical protein
MTIAITFEIEFSPMSRMGSFKKPYRRCRIDCEHISEGFIEFDLCGRTCSFPEQAFKLHILEFFVKVVFEMAEAITMRTSGKNLCTAIKKSLLTIGEKYKGILLAQI